MADAKVETIARLAQWKIDNFGPTIAYKRSNPFKIGIWNWHLSVEKNRPIKIRLFPESSRVSKEQPPVARFVIRVNTSGSNRRSYISSFLCSGDDFACPIDINFQGRLVIDVEFLDLKIYPPNGGEGTSAWTNSGLMQSPATQSTLRRLLRLHDEKIHADVTINTSDGSLRAHKAILCASSSFFYAMFQHDFKEKESSTIDFNDVTTESFEVLLSYFYGKIKQEDFWKHRLTLLDAANKYDIMDLKNACDESLLEDINSENVVERLHVAWLYQLDKLKKGCLTYLLDFGKIDDVREEMNEYLSMAGGELVEIFQGPRVV